MHVFFDAHCHATRKMEAFAEGTRRRLVCGVAPRDWKIVADWAENWEGCIPAFGIHPWEREVFRSGWEEELEAMLLRFPGAWVGEIGLDAAGGRDESLEAQADAFRRQLRTAARLGRGVNVHCVRAHGEALRAMDGEFFSQGGGRCVLHSFGGPHQAVREFAARGAYFSVGPLAARGNTPRIRARVAAIPEERILLESDAFLEPGADAEEELRGALLWLAGVRQTSIEEMTGVIAENSRRILHDGE